MQDFVHQPYYTGVGALAGGSLPRRRPSWPLGHALSPPAGQVPLVAERVHFTLFAIATIPYAAEGLDSLGLISLRFSG